MKEEVLELTFRSPGRCPTCGEQTLFSNDYMENRFVCGYKLGKYPCLRFVPKKPRISKWKSKP